MFIDCLRQKKASPLGFILPKGSFSFFTCCRFAFISIRPKYRFSSYPSLYLLSLRLFILTVAPFMITIAPSSQYLLLLRLLYIYHRSVFFTSIIAPSSHRYPSSFTIGSFTTCPNLSSPCLDHRSALLARSCPL